MRTEKVSKQLILLILNRDPSREHGGALLSGILRGFFLLDIPIWIPFLDPEHVSNLSCTEKETSVHILCECEALASTQTYTGCPRRNVPNFGRVFLMLKYTDITQNTSKVERLRI